MKNVSTITKELPEVNWDFLLPGDDMISINAMFSKFDNILTDCVERNIPVQRITVKK